MEITLHLMGERNTFVLHLKRGGCLKQDDLFWSIYHYITENYEFEFIDNKGIKIDFGNEIWLEYKDLYEYTISILTIRGKFECEPISVLLKNNELSKWFWNELENFGLFKNIFIEE